MKEWGMLHAPSASVRIPVQVISGWNEAAQSAGSGIASVLAGSAALAEKVREVNAAGELAAFSGRLRSIGEEVQAELGAQDVQDWDYSWQQQSEARFAAAVAELSPAVREQGRRLAEDYSRRMSVQAWKNRELERVQRARERWEQRLEEAVRAGDAPAAERWLQSGAGVFVPVEQLPRQSETLRSRACAAGWRAALARNPQQALADYAAAPGEALPQGKNESRELQDEVERCRQQEKSLLAQRLAARVLAGQPRERQELELAVQAGLLEKEQLRTAFARPESLAPQELCRWFTLVDEVEASGGARDALRLRIATAELPEAERRELLERLELGTRVAPGDRRVLCRRLQRIYEAGGLGCPGDAEALERLLELQRAGLELLAQEGAESAARWMATVTTCENNWICFNDK